MWKPGSAKPSNNPSSKRKSRAAQGKNNEGSPGPPAAAASSQKKLSGATMNMRFMQRISDQRQIEKKHQQHKIESPEKAAAADDDTMQVDTTASTEQTQSALVAFYPPQDPEDSLVDTTPASTSDMYGIGVDVIGRRSFGGFNRPTEETWKASYRARKDGDLDNRKKEAQMTDQELLSRYANLRKNGDRPVGNLGDKVKPRKQIRNDQTSGGGKRKRR